MPSALADTNLPCPLSQWILFYGTGTRCLWSSCSQYRLYAPSCGQRPSKALLASSELFENTAHHVSGHGIAVQSVAMDVARMMARKDGIVNKMTKGIEFLFRKNKIHWLK